MVKDIFIRLLFIPLLGLLIPFASHLITYDLYDWWQLLLIHSYFIIVSFVCWFGCNRLHRLIRNRYNLPLNVILRIAVISAVSIVFSSFISGSFIYTWFLVSGETFSYTSLFDSVLYTTIAATVFTLFYEVVYLNREKEEHIKLANTRDKERLYAETAILRNELDPHFIFNSLTTLNQLIKNDPEKAARYNDNLAQVYKYILKNKKKEMVTISEEFLFIEEYLLLLKIRYGNKLLFDTNYENSGSINKLIIPCALQILVENAVKHNEFSEENPLRIKIHLNGNSIKVSNNIMPKPVLIHSTATGLNNLNGRYKLLGREEIKITKNETTYTVTLPLLTTTKPYSHA